MINSVSRNWNHLLISFLGGCVIGLAICHWKVVITSSWEFDNNPKHNLDICKSSEHKHWTKNISDTKMDSMRILCWIMTHPLNHKKKALHVKWTWGKRCTKIIFISSEYDSLLPTIPIIHINNGMDSREYLWQKTQGALKYIYANFLNESDWILRADDDSYVIMENLKLLLKDYNANEPLYFGQRFKTIAKNGFMGGGAGFVLSRNALKRFVEDALPDVTKCPTNITLSSEDDVWISDCLTSVGVKIGQTRDNLGRERFNQLPPKQLLFTGLPEWYTKMVYYYPFERYTNCCSEAVVSFHYITPSQMHILEYFIYHVKVYGLNYNVDWELINNPPQNN